MPGVKAVWLKTIWLYYSRPRGSSHSEAVRSYRVPPLLEAPAGQSRFWVHFNLTFLQLCIYNSQIPSLNYKQKSEVEAGTTKIPARFSSFVSAVWLLLVCARGYGRAHLESQAGMRVTGLDLSQISHEDFLFVTTRKKL